MNIGRKPAVAVGFMFVGLVGVALSACGNDLKTSSGSGTTATTDTRVTLGGPDTTSADTTDTTEATSDTTDTTEATSDTTSDTTDSGGDTKAGVTRDAFIASFTEGFGSSTTKIPKDRVQCIGGEVFDNLDEADLRDIARGGTQSPATKAALSNAFVDCLDISDLLKAADLASSGLDVTCIANNIKFTEADEKDFWDAVLNQQSPPASLETAIAEAKSSC